MDVLPNNCNVGGSGINVNQLPRTKTWTTYIRMPRDPATGVINVITKDMFLTNPRGMVQLHYQNGYDWVPATKKSTEAAADPDNLVTELNEFKAKVKFEVMTQLIKVQYVREDSIMETPQQ